MLIALAVPVARPVIRSGPRRRPGPEPITRAASRASTVRPRDALPDARTRSPRVRPSSRSTESVIPRAPDRKRPARETPSTSTTSPDAEWIRAPPRCTSSASTRTVHCGASPFLPLDGVEGTRSSDRLTRPLRAFLTTTLGSTISRRSMCMRRESSSRSR